MSSTEQMPGSTLAIYTQPRVLAMLVLGFASLAASRVLAIRDFGLWSVVGVLATTIVALTFLPAALVALGPAARTP